MFRSTGSYEPDRYYHTADDTAGKGFDPQALTSLTYTVSFVSASPVSFDPQALTSLTCSCRTSMEDSFSFDPQALTSLTILASISSGVSGCFDPQALTSLTVNARNDSQQRSVSIHRLLRA